MDLLLLILFPGGLVAAAMCAVFRIAGCRHPIALFVFSLALPVIVFLLFMAATRAAGALLPPKPPYTWGPAGVIAGFASVLIGGAFASLAYGLLAHSRRVTCIGLAATAVCAPICLLGLKYRFEMIDRFLWVGACFLWLTVFAISLRPWARREKLARAGLCGACEYNLAGLPAGAARCPECGAGLARSADPVPILASADTAAPPEAPP